MVIGRIREVWRYPVKSMRGERLYVAQIGERGLSGDRRFAVRDLETGKIASAKQVRLWGRLLQCAAATDPSTGDVRITLPDGKVVTIGRDAVDAALCALTDRHVELVDTPPESPEIERYWPDVDGLAKRDTVTSNVIGLGAPQGTFFDYAPLHLLTTATLAALSDFYPTGQVDPRRFRPNLVIELPDEARGFVENEWVGRTLQIGGGLRLRVSNPSPRCVVPTLPQGELTQDLGILRAIAAHNRPSVPALDDARVPCLGVYASVERSGVVRSGDTVRLADAG